MKRRAFALAAVLAAAALLLSNQSLVRGAAPSITGTVKVTGAASNANAVVYIQDGTGAAQPAKAKMDQAKMQFVPHVLPIVSGTTVSFLNSDPTAHNVFSPDNEKFNLGTWQQGTTKEYAFTKCAKFPCVYTLLCRVHPEMEGYIVVLANPHFGVSGSDGHYVIGDVPPGSHTLAVWHPKAKTPSKPVTVTAATVTVDFVLTR